MFGARTMNKILPNVSRRGGSGTASSTVAKIRPTSFFPSSGSSTGAALSFGDVNHNSYSNQTMGQLNRHQVRSFAYDAKNPTHNKIKDIIDKNDVTLFMKGNPIFPQCGFSRTVCEVLKREGLEGKFHSVNVLDDQDVREGIKEYSEWPTIPQLYVKGEFVGGCDIVLGMHRDGELKQELSKVVVEKATSS